MSGVTHTTGVVSATVLGTKIIHGSVPVAGAAKIVRSTLPFTGAAVGLYLVIAAVLLLTGAAFTLLGRRRSS
jgi:hypothetical protein